MNAQTHFITDNHPSTAKDQSEFDGFMDDRAASLDADT
ncbi:MAG: DUF2852 domain-containing protein [Octadecabacter sp.]|nr:DUF2852 domain-containing protein [Octadecabacter sp.]